MTSGFNPISRNSRLTFPYSGLGDQISIVSVLLGFNHENILIVVNSFPRFIKSYFISYCSDKALGVTGFNVMSYADYSTYGARLPVPPLTSSAVTAKDILCSERVLDVTIRALFDGSKSCTVPTDAITYAIFLFLLIIIKYTLYYPSLAFVSLMKLSASLKILSNISTFFSSKGCIISPLVSYFWLDWIILFDKYKSHSKAVE